MKSISKKSLTGKPARLNKYGSYILSPPSADAVPSSAGGGFISLCYQVQNLGESISKKKPYWKTSKA